MCDYIVLIYKYGYIVYCQIINWINIKIKIIVFFNELNIRKMLIRLTTIGCVQILQGLDISPLTGHSD